MKFAIPEISWHNRDPVLSVDFQPKAAAGDPLRLATGGTDSHVLVCNFNLILDNFILYTYRRTKLWRKNKLWKLGKVILRMYKNNCYLQNFITYIRFLIACTVQRLSKGLLRHWTGSVCFATLWLSSISISFTWYPRNILQKLKI